MARQTPYGLTNPHYREEDYIADYNAQSLDPNSTIIKAYRDAFFRNKPSEIGERLAMVLAVKYGIKIPSDLEYFNDEDKKQEFGIGTSKEWVCAICRIFDFHASLPLPGLDQVIVGQSTNTLRDLALIRLTSSKFYATTEDLTSKGVPTLEPGDLIIVEFHDKSTMSNGVIKDLFVKRQAAN